MQTAVASIFIFLIVVTLHELGHFLVAKKVGIKVNEFSIGLGPKLFQRKKGDTMYSLRALPIGGYAAMEGEDEASDVEGSFDSVSPFKRILVVAAGPLVNYVLALSVFIGVFICTGITVNTVNTVNENSPAQVAGIMSKDSIVSVNGFKINNVSEISQKINKSKEGDIVNIKVLRNGEEKDLKVRPKTENGRKVIGIEYDKRVSVVGGIKKGFEFFVRLHKIMVNVFLDLFRGKVGLMDLSGPVGVVKEIGKAASLGFTNLMIFLGFISLNLGFFNFLPIPALDGGRLVFLIFELITSKKLSKEREGQIHFIGFVLLLTLMLVVSIKDIIKLV